MEISGNYHFRRKKFFHLLRYSISILFLWTKTPSALSTYSHVIGSAIHYSSKCVLSQSDSIRNCLIQGDLPQVIVPPLELEMIACTMAEGVCRAFVADMVAPEKRGTAYGLYHSSVGFALLAASLLAGWLWDSISPATPFFFGAGMAVAAMAGLLILLRGEAPLKPARC